MQFAHGGVHDHGAAHFRELDEESSLRIRDFFRGENISYAREEGGDEAEGYAYPFIYCAHCVNVHVIIGAIVYVAGCKINIMMSSRENKNVLHLLPEKDDP